MVTAAIAHTTGDMATHKAVIYTQNALLDQVP